MAPYNPFRFMFRDAFLAGILCFSTILLFSIVGCEKNPVDTPDDPKPANNTVKDHEGHTYKTVKIGEQTWMAENLQVVTYRNGDSIGTTNPITLDLTQMGTTLKYQWPCQGDEAFVPTFGRLYTWDAVTDPRGVCPSGFHVPTDFEMAVLVAAVGDNPTAGGHLKSVGLTHWAPPNTGASNSSGFSGLPAGFRGNHGFFDFELYALFWTSTKQNTNQSYIWYLSFNYEDMLRYADDRKKGYSVRCLKTE
jgi:uncharacterized protein (TIGR02145 family)